MTWLWVAVLLLAVWAAHWGAEHLADPLKNLRKQWGISVSAGGALIGVATASPEIGINTTSAIRGVSDIGLGAMIGANIIALPLLVTVAYVATRKKQLGGEHAGHERHLQQHLLPVDARAVTVLVLPYLGILAIFALLTLPSGWRGLQPLDGWIMLGAYAAFLAQALLRGRGERASVEWSRREIILAVAGIAALAIGAYFTVFSTEKIVSAIGVSKLVGGLFITAPVAALPEIFATWSVSRSGQVTSAVTSVIGDYAVTMTIAVLPLALATLEIENLRLYWINLIFLALLPALYGAFIYRGRPEPGLNRWHVLCLLGVYVLYVPVAVLLGVMRVL